MHGGFAKLYVTIYGLAVTRDRRGSLLGCMFWVTHVFAFEKCPKNVQKRDIPKMREFFTPFLIQTVYFYINSPLMYILSS
jgi:hypothetical protein